MKLFAVYARAAIRGGVQGKRQGTILLPAALVPVRVQSVAS
jgi:hypothetical protein